MELRMPGEILTYTTRKESEESVDKHKRYEQIIEVLKESDRPLSAKEIAVRMHEKGYIPTSERNFTSPRLTELTKKGKVEPVGKTKCEYTHKSVAVFSLKKGQMSIFDLMY